jgi:hypothetical protein
MIIISSLVRSRVRPKVSERCEFDGGMESMETLGALAPKTQYLNLILSPTCRSFTDVSSFSDFEWPRPWATTQIAEGPLQHWTDRKENKVLQSQVSNTSNLNDTRKLYCDSTLDSFYVVYRSGNPDDNRVGGWIGSLAAILIHIGSGRAIYIFLKLIFPALLEATITASSRAICIRTTN